MDLAGGNVIGVGTDLCAIERIATARSRHGQAFLDKVFTPAEQATCLGRGDPDASFAARWAAKEATSKALGTGIGAELGLTSVEVIEDALGAPGIQLDARGEALLRSRNATRVLLSLSHDGGLAIAYVVVVR